MQEISDNFHKIITSFTIWCINVNWINIEKKRLYKQPLFSDFFVLSTTAARTSF